MKNDILAKQHLEYAKNNLKLYLDNRDELNHKINKAQKDYEKKKDDQSYNKLNDLVNEKKTLEYLFKIESTIIKALTIKESILVECKQLDYDFMNQPSNENKVVIDKKPKTQPIKKQVKKEVHEGQLIKITLFDYVVLDLETTGLSAIKDKIIEVGILKVRNHQVIEKYDQLINPQKIISQTITNLTGITNDMVSHAPTIDEVKDDIRQFIGNDAILGHNVTFDISFLKMIYDDLDNDYLDTLYYSRRAFRGVENNQLTTLVKTFHLINNEHRALADCKSTKELYDLIVDKFNGIENLYKNEKYNDQNKLDIHILKKVHIDQDNQLRGKNCIITGHFKMMSKRTANELILQCGATVQKTVNKKVNVVIIGKNPYGQNKTSKHLKAEEKVASGQKIEFITETEFYKIVGLE